MNRLVWKLLRQHISIGQLTGFFLANIFGMLIVLLSVQFYKDVLPVFTQGDSFMKKDYIIATKKISTLRQHYRTKQYFLQGRNQGTGSTTFHTQCRRFYTYPFQSISRTGNGASRYPHLYGYVF